MTKITKQLTPNTGKAVVKGDVAANQPGHSGNHVENSPTAKINHMTHLDHSLALAQKTQTPIP